MEMRMAALTAAVSACHANTDSMLREADKILAWLTAPYQPPHADGQ